MTIKLAKFGIGNIVRHRIHAFRGVIFDVDPIFANSEEWYAAIPADIRPPKDQPWYHVLVHGETHTTYVAECNLEGDETGDPILHPALDVHFSGRTGGL